jgi:hypothetical protein
MRSRLRRLPAALAALCVALAAGGTAHAEDIDEGVRFRSVLVQGNPLGFVIGRYSADLEYLPAPHHALHLTPFYEYALPGTDDQLTGFGAEVGYRFYTSSHGPHGFFAGASFLVSELEYVHGNPANVPGVVADDTQYVQLGGALDVGYQVVVLDAFCIGAGAGLQYTAVTMQPHFEADAHGLHDLVYGWGLRPRVLLQVGAAF